MPDIENRDDCERLVRAFYGRALEDPIIGFIFTDVAQLDLEAHVPEITSFWETVLLGVPSYRGGAFRPHAALHMRVPLRRAPLRPLARAVARDGRLAVRGERAELAKAHAVRVARAFHGRLTATEPPSGGGLTITRHGP